MTYSIMIIVTFVFSLIVLGILVRTNRITLNYTSSLSEDEIGVLILLMVASIVWPVSWSIFIISLFIWGLFNISIYILRLIIGKNNA